ncbi:MAG: tetratricopeptide repeat protein [Acidobacteriia bacterium]|nr:tetratricopeptide repeat protein [Terriglobia bacterium]
MILCQKCAAVNKVGDDVCTKCGTRLMITSAPFYQEPTGTLPMEEHILERLSGLEYEHHKLEERHTELVEIINKLVSGNFYDHKMIEAISEALQKAKVVAGRTLENLWRERVLDFREASERRERFVDRKQRVLALCPEPQRPKLKTRLDDIESRLDAANPNEGVRLLKRLVRDEPRNYELAFLLSEHLYASNRLVEAVPYLRRVLRFNPQHFDSILLLSFVMTNLGQYTDAENILKFALKLRADSHIAHLTMGAVCASQGQQQKAKRHLAKAVDLSPTSSMYFTAGEISANSGWNKEAIRFYKKAIQMDPTFDEACYKLGLIYQKGHQVRAAEKYLRRACQLNPQESRYRDALKASTRKHSRQHS